MLEAQQFSAVSYVASEIDAKLVQRIDLLNQNAKLVAQYVDSPPQIREFLKARIGLQALFKAGLVVIDNSGAGIADYPSIAGRENASFSDREYFKDAIATDKTAIGKPRIGRFSKQLVVAIASPIRNPAGEVIGVLAGLAPLSDKSLFGQVERGMVGKSGKIIISDPRNSLIVSSSNPADILRPLPIHRSFFDQAVAGVEGSALATTPTGTKVLVSTRLLSSANWAVQMVLPTEEAFAPIQSMKRYAYGVAVVLTLLTLGLISFLVRRSLKPLEKVASSIRQMATRPGSLQRLMVSGDKEIQDLAESFNALVDRRRQSEAALRQSEQRLSDAELVSKSGNWELHLDTQMVFASAGAARIYGIGQNPCEFSVAKEVVFLEYRPLLNAAMRDLIEKNKPYDVTFKIRTADTGEIKDIHSIATFDRDKRIFFGVTQDITERLRMQKALEQEESRRRILFEQSHDGIALLRRDGSVVECNVSLAKMLGYSQEELQHMNVRDWDINLSKDEIKKIADTLGLEHINIETRHQRKDGTTYEVEVSLCGIEWVGEQFLLGLHRDITARKQAEIALRESEMRFRAIIEASPIPYAINDDQQNVTYLNASFIKTFGYTVDDIPQLADWWRQACPAPEYREQMVTTWQAKMERAAQESQPFIPVEAELFCKNGEMRTALIASEPLGESLRGLYVVYFFDITSRKKAEQEQRLAATVFSHAREGIMITDADNTILDVNDTFCKITGYSREESLGNTPHLFSSGRHEKSFYAAMWRDLAGNGHWAGEIWDQRKNGEFFPGMLTISAVRDHQGKTQQYVALFSDITAAKDHERQLENMAHFDPLTQLPNRTLLSDRLQQAMSQAARRQQGVAVCYLDLDGFKAVNDQHGHGVGDQLLVALGTMMKQALREGDTLSRIGGDEFVAILLDVIDDNSLLIIVERLLHAVSQPVHLGELVVQVSASLGVTFYPQAEAVDADQLLRQADHAMYQAKLAGKNRYCLFGGTESPRLY